MSTQILYICVAQATIVEIFMFVVRNKTHSFDYFWLHILTSRCSQIWVQRQIPLVMEGLGAIKIHMGLPDMCRLQGIFAVMVMRSKVTVEAWGLRLQAHHRDPDRALQDPQVVVVA